MHIRFARFPLIAAGMAVLAVGVLMPLAPPIALSATRSGQAAATGRWRIVDLVRHCHWDSLSSVIALGPNDAWAVGVPGGDGPYCGAAVEQWTGTSWHHIQVPPGTSLSQPPYEPSAPVAASAANNAWIFPVQEAPAGKLFADDYALHWNGTAWRKSYFGMSLLVNSAAAFGPTDVWAFGTTLPWRESQGFYAARFYGHSWHPVRMPGQPLAVTALSRDDMWAVGPSLNTAGKAPARQVIIAMHWTGRSWHSISVLKIPHTTMAQSYQFPAFAAAAGPRDLWWSYPASGPGGNAANVLLNWNGRRWLSIHVPNPVVGIDGLAPDGHGGIWLTGETYPNFNLVQYWYHYRGGRWTRQVIPSPRGYSNLMAGMAWVPGTTTAWSVGEGDGNSNTVGVIAHYSP